MLAAAIGFLILASLTHTHWVSYVFIFGALFCLANAPKETR